MNIVSKSLFVSTLVLAAALVAGCGRDAAQSEGSNSSNISSVDIPQTAIKAQNRIGFCWAYATTGFLESLLLKKNGQSIDLSEEAIGFYRMAEELTAMSRKYPAAELADADAVGNKTFEGLEGWDLTFNPIYNPQFSARNSLQLVHDYGVVPESVWSYKFQTGEQTDNFFKFVFTSFAALMQANGQGHVTRDMIFNLLASPEAYGSRPPTSFTYVYPNGNHQEMTAQDFAANVIGFSPEDFTYMIPDQQIGYDKLVAATKLTLARGIDVPLSFSIYDGSENRWDASFSAKTLDPSNLSLGGGHAVLITDFVNVGGRPGAIPNAALNAEMAKPANALDFVVIKNSWDTALQSPLLRLPGYFTMDQSYVQLLSHKQSDITIVVPRDIAFQVRYDQ